MINKDTTNPMMAEEDSQELMKMADLVQASYRYNGATAGNVEEHWSKFSARYVKPRSYSAFMKRWLAAACLIGVAGIVLAALLPGLLRNNTSDRVETLPMVSDTESVVETDSIHTSGNMLLLDNVTLQTVMEQVGRMYRVKVSIPDASVAATRMHVQLDRSASLQEVILLLNHFDKVNITLQDGILRVE